MDPRFLDLGTSWKRVILLIHIIFNIRSGLLCTSSERRIILKRILNKYNGVVILDLSGSGQETYGQDNNFSGSIIGEEYLEQPRKTYFKIGSTPSIR
jgi:hypothetical protein